MNTKSLLIAAATLAVGAISSQAQVYSQNIVGYVNVPMVGAGGYTLISNPLDDGAGNQLTNVLASSNLANKSQVVTWNGASYNSAIGKGGGVWASSVPLAPGTGFFVKNAGSATTNTFTGNVVVASGLTVTNGLIAGYSLVGSPVPFAGDATTDTNINLGATLANKSQLISWNSGIQQFDTAVGKGGGAWGSPFNINVGQGFFIKSATAVNWVQTAP